MERGYNTLNSENKYYLYQLVINGKYFPRQPKRNEAEMLWTCDAWPNVTGSDTQNVTLQTEMTERWEM